MKTIYFSILFASLFACKSTKPTAEKTIPQKVEEPMTEPQTETYRTLGVVHLQSNGCPVILEIEEEGVKKNIYPFNLEDKFKVEGLRLRFVYALSRAPQPKDCKCDFVVTLTDVSAIR